MYLCPMKSTSDYIGHGFLEKLEEIDMTCWHLTHVIYKRKKLFVFVHILTGYSVILYGLNKKDFKDISVIFKEALRSSLSSMFFDHTLYEPLVNACGEVCYKKLSDKKAIGTTVYLMNMLSAFTELIDETKVNQLRLSFWLNDMLIKPKNSPNELMTKYLKELRKN